MRTVSFGMQEGARDAMYDERDVLKKFNSHIKHCNDCYDNLGSWESGQPLCSRGHGYFLDMKPYFIFSHGKPYSLIDLQKRNEKTRVLVPSEFRHVNTLFEAVDNGYNPAAMQPIRRPKPTVHHYSAEELTPKREHRRPAPIAVPETEHYITSHRSPRSPRSPRREERYHREPRRGSLYHEDQQRRRYQEDYYR